MWYSEESFKFRGWILKRRVTLDPTLLQKQREIRDSGEDPVRIAW